MLDKKLEKLRRHFNISSPESWQSIRPEWILAVPGIGDTTLNLLRLYLANLGVTLLNDGNPTQWQELLGKTRGGGMEISDANMAEVAPFRIIIDNQEKNPFTFDGIRCDADKDNRPLRVPFEFRSLGASHGDYTIAGWEDCVAIERKSLADAHGTFLGFNERRERFERELQHLAGLECSAVVVECTFGQLMASAPATPNKTEQENAKILMRSVMSWEQKYRVKFAFLDNRRLAELYAFRMMEMFFRRKVEEAKAANKSRTLEVNESHTERIEKMLAEL